MMLVITNAYECCPVIIKISHQQVRRGRGEAEPARGHGAAHQPHLPPAQRHEHAVAARLGGRLGRAAAGLQAPAQDVAGRVPFRTGIGQESKCKAGLRLFAEMQRPSSCVVFVFVHKTAIFI